MTRRSPKLHIGRAGASTRSFICIFIEPNGFNAVTQQFQDVFRALAAASSWAMADPNREAVLLWDNRAIWRSNG